MDNNDQAKAEGIEEEKPQSISRRKALKYIGSGIAAGVLLLSGAGVFLRSGKAPAGSKQTTSNETEAAPIVVTVDTHSPGHRIPADFSGLSFEVGPLLSGNAGFNGYLFSPDNTRLITLFKNIGIKNLRVGGGSVDQRSPIGTGSDGYTGIDKLFEFAKAADTKVLYTFRLLNPIPNPIPDLMDENAKTAQYIWTHYKDHVSSFAIGNEPDWKSYHTYEGHQRDPLIIQTASGVPGSAYPSFLAVWRSFADAIRKLVPEATFSGPETGDYSTSTYTPDPAAGVSWSQHFGEDMADSKMIADITQHYYVGGSPKKTTARQAIRNMLSSDWVNNADVGHQPTGSDSEVTTFTPYPWIYKQNIAPVLKAGLSYRLTESNDYLTGVPGASDAFASALWALDYMHWWAAHQAAGVNFHNKQWLYTDTIVLDSHGSLQTTPKGYGIKAFNLGSIGAVMPVDIANPKALNLTAYAVGEGRQLYITLINKSEGEEAQDASVTIVLPGFKAAKASSIVLTSGKPDDASVMGATLGGTAIANNEEWSGKWTPLEVRKQGEVSLTVQAATAAVIRING